MPMITNTTRPSLCGFKASFLSLANFFPTINVYIAWQIFPGLILIETCY